MNMVRDAGGRLADPGPAPGHPPFLSLAPWIMSTRVSAQGGTWSAHVAAGGARWPLSLSAAPHQ